MVKGEKLQYASRHHEHMEHAVHPFFLHTEQDRAHGIADAAAQQQPEAGGGHDVKEHGSQGDDGSAHADIADHGKDIVFFQVNGG